MAPPKKRQQRLSRTQHILGKIRNFQNQYVNTNFLKRLIFDPSLIWVPAVILVIAEIFVNIVVVQRVPCI